MRVVALIVAFLASFASPALATDDDAARAEMLTAPHAAIFPALAIFLTVLAFNLLGDGLRDALDPRLNR